MKTQLLTFALALALGQTAIAENTTQKIEQVTSSVTLSEDVDYIVTGTTPFATPGSINITNTEHAVVILETCVQAKPSVIFLSLRLTESRRSTMRTVK